MKLQSLTLALVLVAGSSVVANEDITVHVTTTPHETEVTTTTRGAHEVVSVSVTEQAAQPNVVEKATEPAEETK